MRRVYLLMALELAATVLIAWAVIDQSASEQDATELRKSQIAACYRGDVSKADRLIDTRDPDDTPAERHRVRLLFPLLDCDLTVTSGRTVLMAPAEARRFTAIVESSRIPIVRAGHVVGSRPPDGA